MSLSKRKQTARKLVEVSKNKGLTIKRRLLKQIDNISSDDDLDEFCNENFGGIRPHRQKPFWKQINNKK